MPLTKITTTEIDTVSISQVTAGPTIANVSIANSTYVILDDTAVSNAGGFIVVTGTKFQSGAQVLIGNTVATAVTFVDSTTLRVQVPALTAGTYTMYVQNPDGSTGIRLSALTSSPIPVWATGSTLTPQVDSVPISISLAATSDSNVTFSLANGSSLPAGTTLTSNGLFSGTITGLTSDTTYNFSVNAIDTQNQEALRSFSVTVVVGDANFKDTVLLLNGETSNNTWITDVSTNNFAITVNGDTRPTAFSPYETVWSNLFDGTGDDLTIPTNSAFTYGTGDFTIEMWVYITANPGSYAYIYGQGPNTTASMSLYIQGGVFRVWNGSAVIVGSTSYSLNTWYHVAISRSGTSLRLFLNGVQDGSATNSGNITTGSSFGASIGRWSEINDPGYFTGHISNVRVLKGTALYTSAFTPPTSTLTAIANTSLLTCQSNRLIDNSTNNFTITRNGDVSVSNFGPFIETDITTGSGYFDGTGDYLTFLNSSSFAFGTGAFTVEFWINAPLNNDKFILGGRSAIGTMHITTGGSGSTAGVLRYVGSSTIVSTNVITDSSWHHCAIVRDGSSNITLYVDGVSRGTGTDTTNYTSTSGDWKIGSNDNFAGSNILTGHLSNLRILKGTALYTSTFTPPTSPLTAITNTSLLTLQSRFGENNSRFVDTSGLNNIITRNGNTSQGTFSPYQRGGWSNYFDGNGDYLDPPNNVALYIGNLDGTIEFWINPNNVSGFIWSINDSAGDGSFWLQEKIGYNASTKSLYFETNVSQGSSTTYTLSSQSNSVPLNTWTHFAFVKINTTWNIYINGVLNATGVRSNLTTRVSGSTVRIGARGYIAIPEFFSGYISNLRVVKGTALYTSNFTPPTTRLTAVANTSLLTCADNAFIDQSPNNFTITRNGDVSIQPFSPFKVHTITPITHSVYFDGTGDYLTVPSNAAFNFGTGNFTVELWVYVTSFTGGATDVIASTYQNSTSGWTFGIFTDTSKFYFAIAGDSGRLDDTDSLLLNQWVHLMATRSGTTLSFYVNGSRKATATNSTNQTSTSNLFIGASVAATLNFFGYISNFRVVKGTAIYDPTQTTITVPTTLLTAITNTSLLTCASNTIVDLSTANTGNTAHAITVNGDARPTTVNPLGFTVSESTGTSAEYSIVNDGASGYFDGTGDFLAITDRIDLRPGTSNFTLEAWIYRDVAGAAHTIYAKGGASTGIQLQVTSTNVLRFTHTTTNIDSTITIRPKSWTHVAVVREGTSTNQTKLYINGIFAAQGTVSTDFTQTEEARVGTNRAAGENFNGYISGLMFSKGLTRYTSAFVPLNSPRVDANNTLSVNFTNGGIIDYTRKNNLETVGDVKLRNNIVKYGNTSMFFDGTGDYLKFASGYDTQFGSGDFTIEGWIRNNSIATTAALLERRASLTARGIALFFEGSTLKFNAGDTTTTAWEVTIVSGTLSSNTWYHFAFTRSGTTWRAFIDGTQVGSNVTWSGTIADETSNWFVGIAVDNTSAPLNAYIDDFRITKGVARYTSNFSVPTQSFQIR